VSVTDEATEVLNMTDPWLGRQEGEPVTTYQERIRNFTYYSWKVGMGGSSNTQWMTTSHL
jgi:hypothetical protein